MKPLLYTMIHVPALPGTPRHRLSSKEIIAQCEKEAVIYREAGVDGIIVENMHDVPYMARTCGPEIVAMMTRCCQVVRKASGLETGVQILAGANKEALAVALAADCQFIRAEGFVFGHLADEGYIDSDAGELLRYRNAISAEHIKVYTDIKKKHSSHMLTSDISLKETARAAEFFLSDGLIVTGGSTGEAASPADLKEAKSAGTLPVLIGSGITPENVATYQQADGFIVGSWIKKNGDWKEEPDPNRIENMVQAIRSLTLAP